MPVGARPRSRRPAGHSPFPSPAFSSTQKRRRPLSVPASVRARSGGRGRRPINQHLAHYTATTTPTMTTTTVVVVAAAAAAATRTRSSPHGRCRNLLSILLTDKVSERITADDDSRMLSAAPLRAKRCPLSSRTRSGPADGRRRGGGGATTNNHTHHPLNPSITFTPERPSSRPM